MSDEFFSGMRIVLVAIIMFLLNSEIVTKEEELRGLMKRNQELLTHLDQLEQEVAELKQVLEEREEDYENSVFLYKRSLEKTTSQLYSAETVQVNLCMLLTGFAMIAGFAIWSHSLYTSPLLRISA